MRFQPETFRRPIAVMFRRDDLEREKWWTGETNSDMVLFNWLLQGESRMPNQCVVIADGARARFFALQWASLPEVNGGPALLEREVLENPAKVAASAENPSPQSEARGQKRTVYSGSEEARERREEQSGRRFARQIAVRAADFARQQGVQQCVVVADPRTLGMLRRELKAVSKGQLAFTELGKDLCRLSVHEIHAHLARAGHLPARNAPRSVRPAAA